MAEVLLAQVTGPEGFTRPIVLKRILPHLAREDRFRNMFLDEARTVARIRHQNVVQVYELSDDGDELFLVMEYLEGETVGNMLRRLARRRCTLPFALCAYVIAEVCAGLAAAHELTDPHGRSSGVVHRDISPSNLFVTYRGEVKVIDFGIALRDDRLSKTEPGVVKGKRSYMSPEQVRGYELDRRSDLFSLGVVLYELVTGRGLFQRPNTLDTLSAVCCEPVPPPSKLVAGCPPELEDVCLTALDRDVSRRFQGAMDMRQSLLQIAHAEAEGRDLVVWLRDVMEDLFPDRIEQTRRLLADIESGVPPERIRESESESNAVVATVSETITGPAVLSGDPNAPGGLTETKETPDASAPSARRGALGISFLMAAVVAFVVVGMGASRKPAESSDAVVLPPKLTVSLRVQTVPPGARVFLAERDYGRAPVSLSVERGSWPIEISVHEPGRGSMAFRVIPDRDRDLVLSLPNPVEIPVVAGPPDASVASPTPEAKPTRRSSEADVQPARPPERPQPWAPKKPAPPPPEPPQDYERIDDWAHESAD